GRKISTLGFDINPRRIEELKKGVDNTLEVTAGQIAESAKLRFSTKPEDLKECNVYIVTVPTPIDNYKRPDLKPLESASRTVSKTLKAGDIVIYESTVFPGATEEVCVPILEAGSGLTFNKDFFAGYSPE